MLLDALAGDWEPRGAAQHYFNALGGQLSVSVTLRKVQGAVPRSLTDFQDSITVLSLDQLLRVVRPQSRAHEKADIMRSSRLYMMAPTYLRKGKLVYVTHMGLCCLTDYVVSLRSGLRP